MSEHRVVNGPFAIDPVAQLATREGRPLLLGQRGFALFATLLTRPGEVLTKTELMDAAWDGLAVEESNLSVQIASLRKTLGEHPEGGDWIVTIPRVGYRFVNAKPATEAARSSAPRRAIAVLPFVNLSADPEQSYFGDGLAEEIIIALSRVGDLTVIARNSSFAYREAATDVRTIGTELDVDYVIEGSVRKSGNQIRLGVQLADTKTGAQLWAGRYDRELTDVFALQEAVTRQILAELRVTLRPVELVPGGGTKSIEAFELYQRARLVLDAPHQDLAAFRRGAELLERAIAHDPTYANPRAQLAAALVVNYVNHWIGDGPETLLEAKRLADEAIALDPDLSYAHSVRALAAMAGGDADRMATELETALSLNQNDPMATSLHAVWLMFAGRPTEAIPYIERVMRLDPSMQPLHLSQLATAHLYAGRYETAAALYRERILLVPDTDTSRGYLVSALGHLGRLEEARRVWDEVKTINPGYSFRERLYRGGLRDQVVFERLIDGVRKVGIAEDKI
jgi:adenylate cyclase